MKKTKLKLDKTTIRPLTEGAMGRVVGGISVNCVSQRLSGCCDPSNQWTCETYGCGTTATNYC